MLDQHMTLDMWGSPPGAPSVGDFSGYKDHLELAAEAKWIRMGNGHLEPLGEAFLPLVSTPTTYALSLVISSFSLVYNYFFFPHPPCFVLLCLNLSSFPLNPTDVIRIERLWIPNLKQSLNCGLLFYILPMLVITDDKGILQWFHYLTNGIDGNISCKQSCKSYYQDHFPSELQFSKGQPKNPWGLLKHFQGFSILFVCFF